VTIDALTQAHDARSARVCTALSAACALQGSASGANVRLAAPGASRDAAAVAVAAVADTCALNAAAIRCHANDVALPVLSQADPTTAASTVSARVPRACSSPCRAAPCSTSATDWTRACSLNPSKPHWRSVLRAANTGDLRTVLKQTQLHAPAARSNASCGTLGTLETTVRVANAATVCL
jgi:hypothetical protein